MKKEMYTNQRTAYGKTLVELGGIDPRIIVLDADLCGSTMGKMFEQAFPERHIEMGIAEANMVSTAAGIAQTGLVPFANTFAVLKSSLINVSNSLISRIIFSSSSLSVASC